MVNNHKSYFSGRVVGIRCLELLGIIHVSKPNNQSFQLFDCECRQDILDSVNESGDWNENIEAAFRKGIEAFKANGTW